MHKQHGLNWRVGHHAAPEEAPSEWVPAAVPGAVQLDWANAHGWEPYWFGENWRDYRWMEDVYWTYRTTLSMPQLAPGERLLFVCGGVDYQFEIVLRGERIHAQEGMFTPVELDLTGRAAAGDELLVRVFPAPKSVAEPEDRVQANHSCKPTVSYLWDFHPRLIPLGIWQETYLEVRPAASLQAEASYHLSDDLSHVDVQLAAHVSHASGHRLRWSLRAPNGDQAAHVEREAGEGHAELTCTVEQPQLWWPHDQGQPALYHSLAELVGPNGEVIDRVEQRIGFRRVRLVMNPGAWIEPSIFPKSRSRPPITLEINSRQIFAKGANWVSPEIFPGLLSRETYMAHLTLARQANMSILRMWGGAPVQKAAFYELCDELGIMVWQEFPLACNNYPDDPAYLATLDQESRSIITQLRGHASVVMWCGGNELFNNWSGMTDQSLALRLLNRNCFDLDPGRPFLPTSPVEAVGHGNYVFRDMVRNEEAWHIFQRSDASAYCEFGCPGPAPLDVLRRIIPADELFPPRLGTAWESHGALAAWQPTSWLNPDVIEFYFGPSETLEELVERGQLLQAEGYKGLFEEARRQKPQAAMAINWCLNEPWPNAANNSLIAWPSEPKPALAAVGASCRPVLASARIRQFSWRAGELFDPELWMLSDAPEGVAGGQLEAVLRWDAQERVLLSWVFEDLAANTNMRGPRAQVLLPEVQGTFFELHLRVAGRPELDSSYTLRALPASGEVVRGRTLNM